eukprot:10297946-Alexandrium_andersonii.AAC.1
MEFEKNQASGDLLGRHARINTYMLAQAWNAASLPEVSISTEVQATQNSLRIVGSGRRLGFCLGWLDFGIRV